MFSEGVERDRNSHSQMFFKISVFKDFAILTETLALEFLFNKVAKFLRTPPVPAFEETSGIKWDCTS